MRVWEREWASPNWVGEQQLRSDGAANKYKAIMHMSWQLPSQKGGAGAGAGAGGSHTTSGCGWAGAGQERGAVAGGGGACWSWGGQKHLVSVNNGAENSLTKPKPTPTTRALSLSLSVAFSLALSLCYSVALPLACFVTLPLSHYIPLSLSLTRTRAIKLRRLWPKIQTNKPRFDLQPLKSSKTAAGITREKPEKWVESRFW